MGFPFLEDDWRVVRKKLDQQNSKQGQLNKVRVGDFFSALHHVIRAKQRQEMLRLGEDSYKVIT